MGIEHIKKDYKPSKNIEVLKELEDNSAFVKYIEKDGSAYIGVRQYVNSDSVLKEPYFIYYCMPLK